jgi:hypothetical protein
MYGTGHRPGAQARDDRPIALALPSARPRRRSLGVLFLVLGIFFSQYSVVSSPLEVSRVAVAPNPVTAGEIVTVATKLSGGVAPYRYDIAFTSGDGRVDASKMDVKGISSATGDISEQIFTPTEVPKQTDVVITVVVTDTKAVRIQSSPVTLSLRPKSSTTPTTPSPDAK